MPTEDEVAAVIRGLCLIDGADTDDNARRPSLATTIVSSESNTSLKDSLLSDYDVGNDDGSSEDEDEASMMDVVAASDTFDVEVMEEHVLLPPTAVAREGAIYEEDGRNGTRGNNNPRQNIFGINFLQPMKQSPPHRYTKLPTSSCQQEVNKPKQQFMWRTGNSCSNDDESERRVGIFNFFRRNRQHQTYDDKSCLHKDRNEALQNKLVQSPCNTTIDDITTLNNNEVEENDPSNHKNNNNDNNSLRRSNSILQNIVDDFTPKTGDQKILRALGRTAAVNAAVLLTAATGGASAGAIGYVAGGAITSKRLVDGIVAKDDKEVTKSLAVYGCATGASVAGQALAGAIMIGVAGASLPLAGAVAFGVGCCSGITAGALSEWTVDRCMDDEDSKGEQQLGGGDGCSDEKVTGDDDGTVGTLGSDKSMVTSDQSSSRGMKQ